MKSNARLTGYIAAFILLLALGWVASVLFHEAFHAEYTVQVHFQDLGTLKTQDAVVMRGVPIGRVKSLRLQDGQAIAEIEFDHAVTLPEDSRFINFNYSLMGARRVIVTPGSSTTAMNPAQVQEGLSADGVAGSIHRIQKVLELVADLRTQTNRLFVGAGAPLSPEVFRRLERNLEDLNELSQKLDLSGKSLQSGLTAWTRPLQSIRTGLKNSNLDSLEIKTNLVLQAGLTAEDNVNAMLGQAEKILAFAQDSTGPAYPLLSDRRAYEDLKNSLQLLQGAVTHLQNKGVGKLVQWRNLHFFGPRE